jgi:hypothetical protein
LTYSPERASVNQRVQVGAESLTALGTSVPANKNLLPFDFQFGASFDLSNYKATGHKYDVIQEANEEWVDGSMSGSGCYNTLVYPLAGAMGSTTPVASGDSTTAKDWVFTPPITGSKEPQTFTFEQGDGTNAEKLTYGLFTQFGYKFDRKSFEVSGKILAHQLQENITMTASPTSVALAPIVANQINVYIDDAQADLGTTQSLKFISGDFSMDSIYGPAWFVNRANPSFSNHVDLVPKATFKILVEADATGKALLASVRAGVLKYVRVEAIGAEIDADNTINDLFQHDMAVFIGKPDQFTDSDGIYAIGFECTVGEDPTWGKSHEITLTNLITAL